MIMPFADISKLMDTLILMAALLLAFGIALPSAVSFGDLQAADLRCKSNITQNTRSFNAYCGNWKESTEPADLADLSISERFLGYCQSTVIFLGIATVMLFIMIMGAVFAPVPRIDDESTISNRVKLAWLLSCGVSCIVLVVGIFIMFYAVHVHWMIINPRTSNFLPSLWAITASVIGCIAPAMTGWLCYNTKADASSHVKDEAQGGGVELTRSGLDSLLRTLGLLEQYPALEADFELNDLHFLSDEAVFQVLKEVGLVSAGHRVRFIKAMRHAQLTLTTVPPTKPTAQHAAVQRAC